MAGDAVASEELAEERAASQAMVAVKSTTERRRHRAMNAAS